MENNLKKLRENKKITQKELAKKSGISIRTIQAYESNYRDINKMQIANAIQRKKVLKCRIEDLLEVEDLNGEDNDENI